MAATKIAERRRNPRGKPSQLVYIEFGTDNGGMIKNVAEGGMRFFLMNPVIAGHKLHFGMTIDPSRRIEGEASIIWSDASGKSGGLSFAELSPKARQTLRSWLTEIEMDGLLSGQPSSAVVEVPPASIPTPQAELDAAHPVEENSPSKRPRIGSTSHHSARRHSCGRSSGTCSHSGAIRARIRPGSPSNVSCDASSAAVIRRGVPTHCAAARDRFRHARNRAGPCLEGPRVRRRKIAALRQPSFARLRYSPPRHSRGVAPRHARRRCARRKTYARNFPRKNAGRSDATASLPGTTASAERRQRASREPLRFS